MFSKQFNKKRTFWFILLLAFIGLIKIISLDSEFVENSYATGFFKGFAGILRLITGWIPFSLGDILCFFAGAWLLYKTARFFKRMITSPSRMRILGAGMWSVLLTAMVVYVIFNVFWGLNYNRKGIAWQLKLDTEDYSNDDLENIQQLLVQKVNESKRVLIYTHSRYPSEKELYQRSNKCYKQSAEVYPFMRYQNSSVKTSLFSWWGNFLGFTGYYNPFTGEAQLNTTVPPFVLPYTTCHEMAHQLGYAKEDEANFAGYLAATSSTDELFHYSTYLDLFVYANNDVYLVDSVSAKQAFTQLSPEVRSDIKEWRDFLIKHRSFADAFITWVYGKYLKANQQPQGMRTYTRVIANLIAFYKKTGKI